MGKTFFGALLALLLVTTASNATPFSVVTTLPSDPSAAANWYSGSALATSGTVIAVGAPGGDTSDGATTGTGKGYVSLFNCPPAGSATTCVYASDVTGPASGSLFGASIVLLNNGTFLAVGAPGYSSSAGYVQFYSLATVTSPASITSFAPNYASAQLGFAMAGTMSGSTLWVFAGAPYYEETSGAGDCTFSSPCGTVAMYVCTVSGTTYSCPAQTSYAFNDAYNTGYAVAAAVVSSGVVGLATVDPGGKYIMYTFRCTATACGSATTPSPTASYSFGKLFIYLFIYLFILFRQHQLPCGNPQLPRRFGHVHNRQLLSHDGLPVPVELLVIDVHAGFPHNELCPQQRRPVCVAFVIDPAQHRHPGHKLPVLVWIDVFRACDCHWV